MSGAPSRIAFIGFGEAGRAFAAGLRSERAGAGCAMSMYDLLLDDADRDVSAAMREAARALDVRAATDHEDAVRDAEWIVVAVTATTSLQAVRSTVPALRDGQRVLDVNSVSPARKRETESIVLPTRAAYVDVAVMSPVHPALHRTPLLVSGPGARGAMEGFASLGMKAEHVGADTGAASAVKMVRSILVKGLEALLVESMLVGAHYGVLERVLASMQHSHPGLDWTATAGYSIERVVSHGARRAAEMREVATTVAQAGLAPLMASAIAERQQWLADLRVAARFDGAVPPTLEALLPAIDAARGRGAA
jgi:3-hydroxyisobutyrate dehydrogenase-like beta-hydroxyacid dehydrogenase